MILTDTKFASSFLQSPEWERFQRALGRKTWRVGGALIIRHNLARRFNYLYSPRPAVDALRADEFFSELQELARREESIFFKCDPLRELQSTRFLFRPSHSIQPRETVMVDLTKSEDTILGAMHEKTRYNIRLAERKGVIVQQVIATQKRDDVEIFWKLLEETAQRNRFHTHPKAYYERLINVASADFSNEFFFARVDRKIIAAAMVNFYLPSRTATYLHGASRAENRNVMAPHLMHWQILQEAKRRGFERYDFWGIDSARWPGLTRFKLGFGGGAVTYPPSFDIVWRRFAYALYRMGKFYILGKHTARPHARG